MDDALFLCHISCRVVDVDAVTVNMDFSVSYSVQNDQPWCPWLNCTVARDCNSCSTSKTILHSRPLSTASCHLRERGNFIRIEFTCITAGVITTPFLYRVNYCFSHWMSAIKITYVYVTCNCKGRPVGLLYGQPLIRITNNHKR